jgi:2,3-bisphosphoglycerate-dependent phosphoglycerate mutase
LLRSLGMTGGTSSNFLIREGNALSLKLRLRLRLKKSPRIEDPFHSHFPRLFLIFAAVYQNSLRIKTASSMKYTYIYLLLFTLFFSACQSQSAIIKEIKGGKIISSEGKSIDIKGYDDPEAITFFIVRHAEKETDSNDPPLSEVGRQRAVRLASILADVPMDLATSSNYLRTTQTANPFVTNSLKTGNKCEISVYDPSDLPFFFDDIYETRKGQKVLVIGHSNSVPALLNLLTGKEVYTNISETEYDNFYIVSYKGHGKAKVMEMKY